MSMTRREVLGAAAAAAVVSAVARDASAHDHGAPSSLADAAAMCMKTGEACLQHCIDMLASGDTSMAECAKSVRDMLALSTATYKLALSGSKQLKATAKIMAEAAKDCEAQCKKHADKMPVCKACMECCQKLSAEAAKA
jgi:Cys-rich four helix bundle protein (predicted Tat secretion target)